MTDETTIPSFVENLAAIRSKAKSGRLFRRAPTTAVMKAYSEVDDDAIAPETPVAVHESASALEGRKLPDDYHLWTWRRVDGRHVRYRMSPEEYDAGQERRRLEVTRWESMDVDRALADYLAIQNRPLTAEELARELTSRRHSSSK